jgi:hypothetical protein
MNPIGAVIVAHNSGREIGPCLDSLPPGLEVVVVDNASADDTRAEVSHRGNVPLIANPWNRGFAAAANQGIGSLDCEYVLLLNPDVEVISGLDTLLSECEKPGVAAAGGKLLGQDGCPQLGFMLRRFPTPAALSFEVLGFNRLWPGNPVNRRYRCLDLDPDTAAAVEQPAGAMLMLRREAWRKLGGFDESFRPAWFEDVDFLKRVVMAGYTVRYVPSAAAKHKGGHSVAQVPAGAREIYWYGNLLTYVAKHFPRYGRLAMCVALMLGSIFRAAYGIVRSGSLRPVSIYARVFRLAGASLRPAQPEAVVVSSAFGAQ